MCEMSYLGNYILHPISCMKGARTTFHSRIFIREKTYELSRFEMQDDFKRR